MNKAIQIDPLCQHAYYVMGYICLLRKDIKKIIPACERVFELNPNAAFLVGGSAFWMCIVGEYDRGLPMIKRSIRLMPYYPRWFHHAPLLYHLSRGECEQALVEANEFNMPEFFWDPLDKAAILGLLGRKEAANVELRKLPQLNPDFAKRPRHYVNCFVLQEDLLEKLMLGLERAGLAPPSE